MERILIILVGIAFAGFIIGLAGKSVAVKKKSIKKGEFYKILTIISLILMFVFAILYRLLT